MNDPLGSTRRASRPRSRLRRSAGSGCACSASPWLAVVLVAVAASAALARFGGAYADVPFAPPPLPQQPRCCRSRSEGHLAGQGGEDRGAPRLVPADGDLRHGRHLPQSPEGLRGRSPGARGGLLDRHRHRAARPTLGAQSGSSTRRSASSRSFASRRTRSGASRTGPSSKRATNRRRPAQDRFDNVSLGDYALYMPDGYIIHGTIFKTLLGKTGDARLLSGSETRTLNSSTRRFLSALAFSCTSAACSGPPSYPRRARPSSCDSSNSRATSPSSRRSTSLSTRRPSVSTCGCAASCSSASNSSP